jgi:hypothetical protein
MELMTQNANNILKEVEDIAVDYSLTGRIDSEKLAPIIEKIKNGQRKITKVQKEKERLLLNRIKNRQKEILKTVPHIDDVIQKIPLPENADK